MTPFIGQLLCVGFNFAPSGWAVCNGQLLPISQNSALFSLLGTQYGGDGVSTFALPDLRGRAALNAGQGPGLQPYVQGQVGGTENVTLTATQLPAHSHLMNATSNPGSSAHADGNVLASSGSAPIYDPGTGGNGLDSQLAGNAISSTGSGQPFDNHMPYLVMNWIVALQGVYPPRS